jgi:hypothetical protein
MNTEDKNVVEQTENTNSAEVLEEIVKQYSVLSREDLIKELKTLLEKNDFEVLKVRVPIIRNLFLAMPTENKVEEKTEQKVEAKAETEAEKEAEQKENNEAEAPKTENKPKEDTTREEFFNLYELYKQKRQEYNEKQEELKQQNLEKKRKLLEELRVLVESEKTLKEVYDAFNEIQEKWKQIGNVPHAEVNNLWESYRYLMDKFYEKVKISKELRELDLKKNLEEKLALCEKAEELLLSEDINSSFQILQEYHKEWKQIGAVPADKNEEVWERFKKASENINARRKEFYEKRASELEENLKQKQALVEQAKELNAKKREKGSEWNEDANKMNELVEKWKTIGPVTHQYNEEVWNSFKEQKDGFFEARKEAFNQRNQTEEDNYNKKVSICERAEAIAKRTDFTQATQELLALQQEWKQIGFVKKPLGDKVWTRFRAACDEFFKNKSEDYMRTHQEVEENVNKRKQLIEELQGHTFTEDKAKNVEELKEFQKRWFEIGFTPRKERAELQSKWDEIIDANKEKLQITASEIAGRNTRSTEGQRPQGQRGSLNGRIASLDREIDSLENNIGFFSMSKNSEILRKEYETKLNALKQEKERLLQTIKKSKEEKAEQEKAEKAENNQETAENTVNNQENTVENTPNTAE